MTKRNAVPALALLAALMFLPLTRAQQLNRQPGAVYDADFVGQKSGPAPRRSLSGIWEFAEGRNVAIQANGAMAMPSDGKPEHELPKDPENPGWAIKDAVPPEPRWWGYSVGRWVDDYTFVAESNGFDDRTWLDNAGRPHSNALRVVETYRRVDADHIEKTLVIDDPKYYTRPWVAFDRLRMRLQSPSLEIPEQECVPSETAKYNRLFGNPAAGVDDLRQ